MGKRLWALAVVAAVVLVASGRPGAAATYLRTDELLSLQLVNASRAQRSLGALAEHPGLDAIARAQATRMANRGEIYHNPHLGQDADAAGIRWVRLGENVGVGPTAGVIHDAFLASPRHRDNLLYPAYNAMGVGVAPGTGNRSGMIFVAHVFGQLSGVLSAAKPATKPPAAIPRLTSRPAVTPVATVAPRPPPTPKPSPTPNAIVGGVVDRSALVGIALPA